MSYVGIDGCKGGWFAIGLESLEDKDPKFGVFKSIFEYWGRPIPAHGIIIDIPIGISKGKEREETVESGARAWLRQKNSNVYSKRQSSVFSIPCRAAFDFTLEPQFKSVTAYGPHQLDAKAHAGASVINKQMIGRGISAQSFAIMAKILEFDTFLREDPCAASQGNFLESHPELLFQQLNADKPLQHSKRKGLGFLERIEILERYYPNALQIVKQIKDVHKKGLDDHDIVDALVCALAATMIGESGEKETIPSKPLSVDDYRDRMMSSPEEEPRGVMMAIVLPEQEYLKKQYRINF